VGRQAELDGAGANVEPVSVGVGEVGVQEPRPASRRPERDRIPLPIDDTLWVAYTIGGVAHLLGIGQRANWQLPLVHDVRRDSVRRRCRPYRGVRRVRGTRRATDYA